jgi:hypothetical protein
MDPLTYKMFNLHHSSRTLRRTTTMIALLSHEGAAEDHSHGLRTTPQVI